MFRSEWKQFETCSHFYKPNRYFVSVCQISFLCSLKVFNASNVEIVTKTRTEHLSEEDKKRWDCILPAHQPVVIFAPAEFYGPIKLQEQSSRCQFFSWKDSVFQFKMYCRFQKEENDSPIYKVLKLVERRQEFTNEMKQTGSDVYCGLTPEQYLNPNYSMEGHDIGRPKEVKRKPLLLHGS